MDEGGGRGQAKGGGEGPFPVETTAPARVQQLGGLQHADINTDVVSFLHVLLYEHRSHRHPAQVTSHPLLVQTQIKTDSDVFTQQIRTNSHIIHLIDKSCTVRDEIVRVSLTDSHHTIIRNTHPCCMGFLC